VITLEINTSLYFLYPSF